MTARMCKFCGGNADALGPAFCCDNRARYKAMQAGEWPAFSLEHLHRDLKCCGSHVGACVCDSRIQ